MTGNHLWAGRYDRGLEDIFAVQDEITQNVVTTVAPELLAAETARARRKTPDNLDAWDYYLRAVWHYQRQTRDDNATALRLAETSTRLSPDDPLGFSALAGCHLAAALYSWGKSDEQSSSAGFEAATRAVELDNRDATANTSLGLANLYSRRHREDIRRFEKAIELNPNHAHAHALLGWGLPASAIASMPYPRSRKPYG